MSRPVQNPTKHAIQYAIKSAIKRRVNLTTQHCMKPWQLAITLLLLIFITPVLMTTELHAQSLKSLEQASKNLSSAKNAVNLSNQLQQQLARNLKSLTPHDFVVAADTYGNLVAGAREQGGGRTEFQHLLKRGEGLYQRCREKIRNLEQATQEREAALEQLYRSDLWHDINYALSASVYWKAWAMLGLAHGYSGNKQQVKWLNKAERGFQGTSVRILYPGIVYGSWLGMAYVAQARGDDSLAEQRFKRLAQSLDSENATRKIAESELNLLAMRKGALGGKLPKISGEPLTPATARLYQEQAFMLLERRKKTKSGGYDAAKRLKMVIEQGYLDNALLNRILAYRDEIAGRDIGTLSLYIDSEFAYATKQYSTAVLKYQDFRKQGGLKLPINTNMLQYHYAVALLKIKLAREAYVEVESLQRKKQLRSSLVKALPKLKFLAAKALYERRDTKDNRKRILAAAENFLRANPKDKGAGSAHLLIAQLSEDTKKSAYHLKLAKKNRNLKGSAALTQMQRAISTFNKAVSSNNAALQEKQAKRILAALAGLSRSKRKAPWFKAVSLQMQTVLKQDAAGILAKIEAMYAAEKAKPGNKKFALSLQVRRVLLWTKLRALDAKPGGKALLSFIKGLNKTTIDSMTQKEIFLLIRDKEKQKEFEQALALSHAILPLLENQDQRQMRLMQVRTSLALGKNEQAYRIAKQLTVDYPGSGDAWVAYAENAEHTAHWFEAERAWAKISKGQAEGSPHWRKAMLKRIDLLAAENRQEGQSAKKGPNTRLCQIIVRTHAYQHLLTPAENTVFQEEREHWLCNSANS